MLVDLLKKNLTPTIDWKLREKELIELSKKYKDFKGPYNCIVPEVVEKIVLINLIF